MKKLLLTIGLVSSLFAGGLTQMDSQDLCFKSRNYPVSYTAAFNAMKNTLIDTNMHLKEISKEDGFISAEGSRTFDGNQYKFTFTISFVKKGDITSIKTLVSYDLISEENEVQGVSSFNIPIPVPWSKVFKYKGTTNVDNPEFFDSFYTNYDKELFEYQMKKMDVEIAKTTDTILLKDIDNKKVKKIKIKDQNISKLDTNKTVEVINTEDKNSSK